MARRNVSVNISDRQGSSRAASPGIFSSVFAIISKMANTRTSCRYYRPPALGLTTSRHGYSYLFSLGQPASQPGTWPGRVEMNN